MTRPPGTTIDDWPDTIKRRRNGKCYRCNECRRRASNPPPKTRITCKRCGTVFTRKPSERREYCTTTCYHRARNEQKAAQMRANYTPAERHTHTCDHCGKPYAPAPRATQRFCQPKCRWAAQRAKARATRQEAAA